MKRWLVVLLVLLALIVLLSPGIVGRMAEKNMTENIEWAESDSPGVSIQTESFERGWFTSEGRHRIVLEGGQFQDATDRYMESTGNETLPSLIVNTRLDHGLLPVSSLSRDDGSISPGLANTVSTFEIDPGNGETIEVPGKMTSVVGLTGSTASHLVLDAGTFEADDTSIEWQGVDLQIDSNPASGAMSATGAIKPWKIMADDAVIDLGAIDIEADQVRSDYGFNVGSVEMTMGAIAVQDGSTAVSMEGLSVSADSSIADDRLNAQTVFEMNTMTIPGMGDLDFTLDMALEGVDAASIGVIGKAIQEAQSADDPQTALAGLYPDIESDVQALFNRGFSFRLDTLDVSLPQGVIASDMQVTVPESDDDAAFSWPSVLLNMTASMNLRVPGSVYDMAAMMNPQAGSLLAMGILKPDGDDYVMEAEYAQGLINVNGAPMPLPIPGL